MDSDLKPCPFCGNEIMVGINSKYIESITEEIRHVFLIECQSCGCSKRGLSSFDSVIAEQNANNAWNDRGKVDLDKKELTDWILCEASHFLIANEIPNEEIGKTFSSDDVNIIKAKLLRDVANVIKYGEYK